MPTRPTCPRGSRAAGARAGRPPCACHRRARSTTSSRRPTTPACCVRRADRSASDCWSPRRRSCNRSCLPARDLQVLEFDPSRRLSDGELRRLAPAADFERTLIGIHAEGEGSPYIWGLASSGRQWIRHLQSGREGDDASLPDALVVHVLSPGHVLMARGSTALVELQGGRLRESDHDVFRSVWLPALFAPVRAEVVRQCDALPGGTTRPTVSDDVVRAVAQHMLRRALSAIRRARHGGTLLIVPPDDAGDLVVPGVTLKYRFADQDTRRRFRQLILSIVATLQDDASAARRDARGLGVLPGARAGRVARARRGGPGTRAVDGVARDGGWRGGDEPAFRAPRVRRRDHRRRAGAADSPCGGPRGHRDRPRRWWTAKAPAIAPSTASVRPFPDSLAFVVSQDGGITVVHARDRRVLCWEQRTFGL